MPSSMTAFASRTQQFDWGIATWEIRSVNHRYLETWFRLPETARDQEMLLREKARKTLHRGKLDCQLQIQLNTQNQSIELNTALAQQYINAANQMAGLMKSSAPVSPLEMLRWPGILKEPEQDNEAINRDLNHLFSETLSQLASDRLREGAKLADMILTRLDAIDLLSTEVRKAMPEITASQQQKITDKLAELKSELNQDRIEQELVFIAQKADVDEELDRLVTHTEEIRKTLGKKGAIGRRLDFLMQELNREANTLGSKSIAQLTSQTSIELKVLIEQMREQIQNIE